MTYKFVILFLEYAETHNLQCQLRAKPHSGNYAADLNSFCIKILQTGKYDLFWKFYSIYLCTTCVVLKRRMG